VRVVGGRGWEVLGEGGQLVANREAGYVGQNGEGAQTRCGGWNKGLTFLMCGVRET